MTGESASVLRDQVAIVTRVDSPLGEATALALARAGAAVCANGLNPARVDQVIEQIVADGGRALGWNGDLSNRFQVSALIEAVRAAFGRLDTVACVADYERPASVLQLDEYDWRRVLDLNLTSAFFFIQLAGRVMVEAGGGALIILVPTAPAAPNPGSAVFTSSLAGAEGLVRAAAVDLWESNVRVSLLRAERGAADPDLGTALVYLCSRTTAEFSGAALTTAAVARRALNV